MVVVVLLAACGEGSTGLGEISDDPAIRDTSLELVVRPGKSYQNVAVIADGGTCQIDRQGIQNQVLYPSLSSCGYAFDPSEGRVRAFVHAEVGGCYSGSGLCEAQPIETVSRAIRLTRDFTVSGSSTDRPLQGSLFRSTIAWGIYQWASGIPLHKGETTIRIDFELLNITNPDAPVDAMPPETPYNEGATGNKVIGSFKGIPIPAGWDQFSDSSPEEVIGGPATLHPGQRYRIELSIHLEAKSSKAAPWFSRASVGEPPLDPGFGPIRPPPGQVRWLEINLLAGSRSGS